MKKFCLSVMLLFIVFSVSAQYLIKSVAGTGALGYSGDGGPGTAAELRIPLYVCTDAIGNLYISDQGNQRIRKVDATTGIITTIAGKGGGGNTGDGGAATDATIQSPKGICIDSENNLYICSQWYVRKVNLATGIITSIAGNSSAGHMGDGGLATAAQISPMAIAADKYNNIYITGAYKVRKITAATGIISTIAGTGSSGSYGDGGPAIDAAFGYSMGIAVSPTNDIYITDIHKIRKIDALTGIISTVAGSGAPGYSGDGSLAVAAELKSVSGVAVDTAGNIYVADLANYVIRKITLSTGIITTIAGKGSLGYSGDGGPATAAEFRFPWGICVNKTGSVVYVADRDEPIRKLYLPGVGVKDVPALQPPDAYPNPTNGLLTIATNRAEECAVTICNTLGQRVRLLTIKGQSAEVDLSQQPEGVYFVHMSCGGRVWSVRVVKE